MAVLSKGRAFLTVGRLACDGKSIPNVTQGVPAKRERLTGIPVNHGIDLQTSQVSARHCRQALVVEAPDSLAWGDCRESAA